MSGHVPHEFSSVSVSAYESATLSALLQERSAEGWAVVSIVPAGTSVVAFLSRPMSGAASTTTTAAAATTVSPEPVTPTPAASGAGWALQPESASSTQTSSAADTPSATTTSTSTTTSTAGSAQSSGAAPAGWYADPSGRFELRYWDGGRWTEHVSRGGNQYTDPPVA